MHVLLTANCGHAFSDSRTHKTIFLSLMTILCTVIKGLDKSCLEVFVRCPFAHEVANIEYT